MIDWANLSWECHVCGETRPDPFISVYTTELISHGAPIKQNVRHCNDRESCVEGAKKIQWVKADR